MIFYFKRTHTACEQHITRAGRLRLTPALVRASLQAMHNPSPGVCVYCGKPFVAYRKVTLYCRPRCAHRARYRRSLKGKPARMLDRQEERKHPNPIAG